MSKRKHRINKEMIEINRISERYNKWVHVITQFRVSCYSRSRKSPEYTNALFPKGCTVLWAQVRTSSVGTTPTSSRLLLKQSYFCSFPRISIRPHGRIKASALTTHIRGRHSDYSHHGNITRSVPPTKCLGKEYQQWNVTESQELINNQ